MESAATRLKRLREQTAPRLTIRGLADALGMNHSTYAFYEDATKFKKTVLPIELAKSIADLFAERGVQREAVMALAGVGIPDPGPSAESLRNVMPTRAVEAVVASNNTVPLKQIDMSFSMGPGSNIDDYVEEGTIEFDANLLRSITRAPAERLLVARGEGDSMFPTLINDDMVVIDTTQRILNLHDRIWACAVHGSGAIKRLRAVGKGQVEVISDNPNVNNQVVNGDDLTLFGRVVWVGRKV